MCELALNGKLWSPRGPGAGRASLSSGGRWTERPSLPGARTACGEEGGAQGLEGEGRGGGAYRAAALPRAPDAVKFSASTLPTLHF